MNAHVWSLRAARRLTLNSPLVALFLSVSGCPKAGGGSSGITIPQSDGTPPTLSLGAGQQGTQDVAVNVGGPAMTKTLTSKTGKLTLFATANDQESGVQSLQIWVSTSETSCDANGLCSTSGPGLVSKPRFEFTSPAKQPGETASASRSMLQSLDLSAEIPQGSGPPGGSYEFHFAISAVAVNNLGKRSQTPTLSVTWKE